MFLWWFSCLLKLKENSDFCFCFLLKTYHPSRVLTLVYQPFALGTMAILAYNEARIDTRKRNILGFLLFSISTFLLIVVSTISACTFNLSGICVSSVILHWENWSSILVSHDFFICLIHNNPFFTGQLDLASSGRGGPGPFVGICVLVAAFGVADAHVQGGMVGDLAFMNPAFMQVWHFMLRLSFKHLALH